jgi:glyoxylase-like metal-dependent hydrolase (beta-lactamase superfamily II)
MIQRRHSPHEDRVSRHPGKIDARTDRHHRHTYLLVEYHRLRPIDCGQDWPGEIEKIDPHAIVITHALPDHAWGLKEGASRPVCATKESWEDMKNHPIGERRTIQHRSPATIGGVRVSLAHHEMERVLR